MITINMSLWLISSVLLNVHCNHTSNIYSTHTHTHTNIPLILSFSSYHNTIHIHTGLFCTATSTVNILCVLLIVHFPSCCCYCFVIFTQLMTVTGIQYLSSYCIHSHYCYSSTSCCPVIMHCCSSAFLTLSSVLFALCVFWPFLHLCSFVLFLIVVCVHGWNNNKPTWLEYIYTKEYFSNKSTVNSLSQSKHSRETAPCS